LKLAKTTTVGTSVTLALAMGIIYKLPAKLAYLTGLPFRPK